MNKELTEIYIPMDDDSDEEFEYQLYQGFGELWICPLNPSMAIILTKEEWEGLCNELSALNSNIPYPGHWESLRKEIERLTSLIETSWYDGYCKAGEKELAYELLQQFKKENNL